ncbi:hypothetical protein E3N88_35361 [Mikania micrantha]|uniref:Uncharacterized protein n=1 Tax=Mikania micrantha TaxID=192012 RepID=A0A5N6M186_9ASTR|nr:hypothetical protein E3N88_35361 [Mikania micrantha]
MIKRRSSRGALASASPNAGEPPADHLPCFRLSSSGHHPGSTPANVTTTIFPFSVELAPSATPISGNTSSSLQIILLSSLHPQTHTGPIGRVDKEKLCYSSGQLRKYSDTVVPPGGCGGSCPSNSGGLGKGFRTRPSRCLHRRRRWRLDGLERDSGTHMTTVVGDGYFGVSVAKGLFSALKGPPPAVEVVTKWDLKPSVVLGSNFLLVVDRILDPELLGMLKW